MAATDTANINDSASPCWNFDLVYASNLPVFNTGQGVGINHPLSFMGGLYFNMANKLLLDGTPSTFSREQFPQSGTKKFAQGPWMTHMQYNHGLPVSDDFRPFYIASEQGTGYAAFYTFERYMPTGTQYGSRIQPVILMTVTQIFHIDGSTTPTTGYLYMKPLPDGSQGQMYVAQLGTRDEVVAADAHFGILGVSPADTGPASVLISYYSKDCTNTQLMIIINSGYGDRGENRAVSVSGQYYLWLGLYAEKDKGTGGIRWEAIAGDGDSGSNNSVRANEILSPLSLAYNPATMLVQKTTIDAFVTASSDTGDNSFNTRFLPSLQKMFTWELFLPVNNYEPKGAMGLANRDSAVSVYLDNRCTGIDREPVHAPSSAVAAGKADQICRTGFPTCTKFTSNSPTGLACQAAAAISIPATKKVYQAICGVDAGGKSISTPPLAKDEAALATPDCACINYPQSTYKQASMMGMDYKQFTDWRNENRIPNMLPEGRCWWPSCTNPSNTLRFPDDPVPGSPAATAVTPQAGQAACGTVINCIAAMRGITVDHDSIANATIVQNCGGVANTDTPPGAEGMNGGTDDYHTPSSGPGPAGVMDQVKLWPKQSWFIPVVVVLGILILAAIGWYVYQNYFSKTTTAEAPLKPMSGMAPMVPRPPAGTKAQ